MQYRGRTKNDVRLMLRHDLPGMAWSDINLTPKVENATKLKISLPPNDGPNKIISDAFIDDLHPNLPTTSFITLYNLPSACIHQHNNHSTSLHNNPLSRNNYTIFETWFRDLVIQKEVCESMCR